MRGSKKPIEQHLRDGTFHPSHHTPVKVGNRMTDMSPSVELEGWALNFFFMIAEEMNEMELLKPEDMHLITTLSIQADLIQGSYKAVKKQGRVIKRKNGDKVLNPEIRVLKDAVSEFGKIAKSLGIGPLARQKLHDARAMSQEKENGTSLNLD